MPLLNPVLKFISHPMNSFRCQPAMANLTLRKKKHEQVPSSDL